MFFSRSVDEKCFSHLADEKCFFFHAWRTKKDFFTLGGRKTVIHAWRTKNVFLCLADEKCFFSRLAAEKCFFHVGMMVGRTVPEIRFRCGLVFTTHNAHWVKMNDFDAHAIQNLQSRKFWLMPLVWLISDPTLKQSICERNCSFFGLLECSIKMYFLSFCHFFVDPVSFWKRVNQGVLAFRCLFVFSK